MNFKSLHLAKQKLGTPYERIKNLKRENEFLKKAIREMCHEKTWLLKLMEKRT